MKKICIILSALTLALSLASCKNYDVSDGEYDRYNDDRFVRDRRTVGQRIDDGINRGARGIQRGFDNAERGFENVTGMDTDR